MQKTTRNASPWLVAATACALAPSAGLAAEPNDALGEVVVTARRAAESLQTVPVTVEAYTAAAIENAGIKRPQDLFAQTSNILFINAAESGDTQVVIRGINNPRDFDPSYALVVDGIQQPDPFALNRDFVDIQQIEVVKGPVSALYGRNALGGAILITTRAPEEEFEGYVKAVGGNGSFKQLVGSVSGPLGTPALKGRLALSYNDQDGVLKNEYLGGHVDYYTEKRARARVLWTPGESFSLDVTGEYAEIDGNAINFIMQTPFFPAIQPQFADGVNINDTSVPYGNNVKSVNPAERRDVLAKAEWRTDAGTFLVAAGYNKNENFFGSDYILQFIPVAPFAVFEGVSLAGPGANNALDLVGYSPFPGSIAWQRRNGESKSVEVRFTSPDSRSVRWSVGAYGAQVERSVFVSVDRDPGDGSIQKAHPNPFTVNVTEDQLTETDVTSAYGQLFYNPVPSVELAAAGRWDREERKSINQLDPAYAALPSLAAFTGLVREDTFRRFQPRVSARWSVTPDHTVYLAYGEGFRSGGFNAPGTRDTVLQIDQLPATVNIFDIYKPQIVKGVDAGLRSVFADGRLRVNVALFKTRSTNTQLFEFTPVTSTRARVTIDRSDSTGGEVELQWRTPIPGLAIAASYGYTDSEIKENQGNPGSIGNPVPSVPKDTLNVSLEHSLPLSGTLSLYSRLGLQRIGETPFDINDAPGTARNAVDLVDARIALEGGAWTLALWGRNLTDERYFSDAVVVTLNGAAPFNKLLLAPYGEPRRYGAELTYRF